MEVVILILAAVVIAVYFARKEKRPNSSAGQDYREAKGINDKHKR